MDGRGSSLERRQRKREGESATKEMWKREAEKQLFMGG